MFYGVHTRIGNRDHQEDRFSIVVKENYNLFAIYDGHGGAMVAKYCKSNFPAFLIDFSAFVSSADMEMTLKNAFLHFDKHLYDKFGDTLDRIGSTCTVILLAYGRIYCINIGDSEACLYREGGKAIELTDSHTPYKEKEIKRIQDEGGRTYYGRVVVDNVGLSVSRSFGDFLHKIPLYLVSAEPTVKSIILDDECKFIVLASDGLWGDITFPEVCKFVQDKINEIDQISAPNLSAIANMLVDYVIKVTDTEVENTTVIIIQLNNKTKRANLVDLSSNKKVNSLDFHLKNLLAEKIEEPMFYLNIQNRDLILKLLGKEYPYPCWVPQKLISEKLFGKASLEHIDDILRFHKQVFVWAPEFSNVHTTFDYEETPIRIDEIEYAGPEQYFQAAKSIGTPDQEKALEAIRMVADPAKAYQLGRKFKLRKDWEQVKDDVMYTAIQAKFTQNNKLKELLLSTGSYLLVQIKPGDFYWGTGIDGKGKNRLGELLTKLRNEI